MSPDDDKTRTHIALTQGTMVSHYRIIDKIGAGGMGEVYLAEDTQLDRKVALKFLPPHLCADVECRARFKREAQAAAKLSHPNIITIHEVSDYQGRPFIAMEHIEGSVLKEHSQDRDMTIDQVLELGIQICEGLQAAHEKGVTHRDIKPSNILIDSYGRARIVDFGLAAVRGTDQLTKTGSTMGTIGYMSPEQVRGQQVDHRSDLFSLGVVLYELLTRQSPFKRGSEAATLKAVSDDEPHPVARYRSDVSDGLQAIIDKALEKDAKTRYQHADGMLSDLMRVKRSMETPGSTGAMVARTGRSRIGLWVAAAVVVVAAVALLVARPWESRTALDAPDKIMLAVLPFQNLGVPEDEYFADGITGEITSRLAQVSAFRIISRTSTMVYKNTTKTISQIGEELGVDYILEGTILWDKSGDTDYVRITPQLIRVDKDYHVWADNIERPLTRLFAVQADIATRITEALNVTLLEREQQVVRAEPTNSTEAYDYFMLGISYADRRFDLSNALIAVEMFEKAVAIDSCFVQGFTNLSGSLLFIYWYHQADQQILLRAKAAIERAAELDPDDPMVHEALARYYYHGHRDYSRALEEVAHARRLMPDNPDILTTIGAIKRRQGKWNEAVECFEKSFELNARSAINAWEIGISYMCIRRYDLAADWCNRAISLQPDWAYPYRDLVKLHLLRDGDYATAYSVLESASPSVDTAKLISAWVRCDKFARDYTRALNRLPADAGLMTRGDIYHLLGDTARSTACFDSARIILEQAGPDGLNFIGQRESRLSIAYAHLKRSEDAIRLGQQALNMNPVSNDAFTGTYRLTDMVDTYILLGERERAIDLCEELLSIPSELSAAYLKGHPLFDPLRDHPRFQALIEKYEKEQGT